MTVNVLRAVEDYSYAESLTAVEWAELARSPEFSEMVGELPHLAAPFIERFASNLPEHSATATGAPPPPGGPYDAIGSSLPRTHGFGIVTGLGRYTQNMVVPGMLFMKTLRSPHPHARVKAIDASRAESLPGVQMVVHQFNIPREYQESRLGGGPPFRYLFSEEVFEVGAPIAIVAADSEHIADEALHLIAVEYEVLPPVFNFLEAMRPGAAKQWENRFDGTITGIASPLVRGDPDGAMGRADFTVEGVTSRSTEQHLALEMTTSISWWDAGRLVMYYTNQHAHGTRAGLSQILRLPEHMIRVIQPGYMGSGYGYRSGIDLAEVHGALLSKLTARPVRAMYTRSEDFVTRTHRPQFHNESKLAVNRDGTIVAGHFKVIANVGAQQGSAASGAWHTMQNLYTIPNLKLEGIDVFTNSYKSGPYRCVSHPNGTLALETLMDKAAYRIGMDPVAFRLRNLNEVGTPETGRPFSNPGIRDCIVGAANEIGWSQKWHAPRTREVRPGVYHGIGFAAHVCNHGAGSSPSTGEVVVNNDGTMQIRSGLTEIGQGNRSTLVLIAAETVGIPVEKTFINPEVDTDFTRDTAATNGSRQTNSGGWGVYEGALDAHRQLQEWGARRLTDDARRAGRDLTIRPDDVDVKRGEVFLVSDPSLKTTVAEVVRLATAPIVGRGTHVQDPTWERVAWAAHAAEVEVDTVTGTISVTKYVAAHDVGRALNPFNVEQQIEGGVIMGLGAALTEQLLVDEATGLPLNDNILDYKALSIKDVPEKIDVVIVERPKEYGVYGAHGLGEPPIAPAGAVVINAVYNAVGVWVESMPLTREKVLAALRRG